MHICKLIIIAVIALLLSLVLVSIGADVDIILTDKTPHYERGNLDLSVDGGSNYAVRIANGYPENNNTNIIHYSLPDVPSLLTDNAILRWQLLRVRGKKTTGPDSVIGNVFKICGIHIVVPEEGKTYSNYIPVKWISNEAGQQVQIGISTNAGRSYVRLAYADNHDGTNSFDVTILAGMSGRVTLAISSLTDPKCNGISKEFFVQ